MSMKAADVKVAGWFASLPMTDPRCNNDSCIAFEKAHKASQAAAPYTDQFLYGHYTLWIMAVVIFLASVHFFSQMLLGAKTRKSESEKESSGGPGLLDKLSATVRWISYRRLPGRFAAYFALPSLGVSILIACSWIAISVMSFAKTPYYRERRGFGSPPLAIRTGLMAFALVPITFATAGKVNIITYLTGLGHEKLNTFHRWMGYLMLYVSLLHAIPFIVQPLREGGSEFLHQRFYSPGSMEFKGIPPLGMLVGLAALSIAPIRRKVYELFIHLHILLAVAYLGLLFWHTGDMGDSWAYLWATVAIFGFQIVVRVFGKTSTFKLRANWFDNAPVTLKPLDKDMMKLELDVQGLWSWEPGQHVFLRFPTIRPLDNHPFTIASIPERPEPGARVKDSAKMVFYMRPLKGMTRRIANLAESGKTTTVTVDGPYGTIIRPKVESRYDSAILIAGGGGISGMLPWLQHLTMKMRDNESSVIRSVTLVWIIRKQASREWVRDELEALQEIAPQGSVNLEIWVTGEADGYDSVSSDQSSSSGESPETKETKETITSTRNWDSDRSESDFATGLRFGRRPEMSDVLDRHMGKGRTIVLGCGPQSLKTDLSNAVASRQARVFKGESQELRLHTETFGW